MRVLVLDDHDDFRLEVETMLTSSGHEARGVGMAKEAIALAETGNYDIVLVDFNMPEHNGIWFMENVSLPRETKAILVTAHVSKYIINEMFRSGVSGYIIKPFSASDLLRHLEFHGEGCR